MTTIDRYQTPNAPAPQPRAVVFELARYQTPVVYPAPVFGAWSPTAGAVGRTAAVQVTVTSPVGFAQVVIWATLADGTGIVVYDGATWGPAFDAASSITGTTILTLTIAADAPGWAQNYTLHVLARSAQGITAASSSAYSLTNPPTVSPVAVALVSPADLGSLRQGSTVPIVVRVTSSSPLAAVFVWAEYDFGRTEVVRSGVGFSDPFSISTTANIAGGLELALRRLGGWPSATVRLHVEPVDAAGNTA